MPAATAKKAERENEGERPASQEDRGNRANRQNPETPLTAEETAIPQVFKSAGYPTALLGKWGVGENGSTGA